MHSEHRRRYHLLPLADVHPGDRISTDADAIAAITRGDADTIDWNEVDACAAQVLARRRISPSKLAFGVRRAQQPVTGIEGSAAASLLVSKPPNAI